MRQPGTHRFFDEEGHLVEVKVFRDGVLSATGMLDSLDVEQGHEGVLAGRAGASGPYAEGLRDGDWQFFARDGRLSRRRLPVSQWHGRWIWYHPDGSKHRDERYRKGREDGEFTEW